MKISQLPGNALAEYGIIAGLVGITCVGGLTAVGDSLNLGFDSIGSQFNGNIAASAPPSNGPNQAPGSSSAPSSNAIATQSPPQNTLPAPAAGQEQACFESGWCVNVPVVSNTVVDSTTGAIGTKLTHEFANVLGQIAKQMEATGNPDPNLLNLITQLALEGHTLADLEQGVIDVCPPGQTCSTTTSSTGGISYSSSDSLLGKALMSVNGQNGNFQKLYAQVEAYLQVNPNSLPPEMANIIHLEAGEIIKIANAYNTGANANVSAVNGTASINESWDFAYDAELTHQSANTICSNGGDSIQCVQ